MADDYLLGDSDPELARLREQHAVWREVTQDGWCVAGLQEGDRVLDVGSGPGFTTRELSDRVGPAGRVVALDPSERFSRHLEARAAQEQRDNIAVCTQAIEDYAPEDGIGFDLIHVRWVLCFLPDPGSALARLARLLKPGGRLVTLDYFNYHAFALAPRIDTMATVVQAVHDSWSQSGGSLEVQGETPANCAAAGLALTNVAQVSGIARPGDPRFDWPEDFLRGYVPRLVEAGLLTEETGEAFLRDWAQRKAEPGTFLYRPPLLRVIARRPD
ncbi:MAG: methyltransferase domain-containing protein [Pseudomonadota bacterium]